MPKAAKGSIIRNAIFRESLTLKAVAEDVQRPIIKLAQNKDINGATSWV